MWEPGNDPQWRYLGGPRWLAGDVVRSTCVGGAGGSDIYVATDGGITRLSQERWSLSRKAAVLTEALLARHDRHGLVAECTMSRYGDVSSCVQEDSDNNGLWTSLVVVAMYMRHAVTGEPEALAAASKFVCRLTRVLWGVCQAQRTECLLDNVINDATWRVHFEHAFFPPTQ